MIKQATTIAPRKAFQKHFNLSGFSSDHLTQAEEPEVLLLKSTKDLDGFSELIDYKETAQTKRLRNQIIEINRQLLLAEITISFNRNSRSINEKQFLVSSHYRSLRRVFNNGTWTDGGRLFGGFWMNMERKERFSAIRISGEKIANVDYSSLFTRLAYAQGKAKHPTMDSYDIHGDGSSRDGWKTLMNALLFAKAPLRQWPDGSRELFEKETSLREAVSLVKERHHPIAHLFEQGLGFQLMRIESDILISILKHLQDNEVPALPLHDSVLVPISAAKRAKSVMENEFKRRTGLSRAYVSIDYGDLG
ncbi:MAG: hypothetical protein K2P86_00650 [Xanthobacteraceae bacterium]|nr:hypothetical protein [Xanthobacteraceae bacterium]